MYADLQVQKFCHQYRSHGEDSVHEDFLSFCRTCETQEQDGRTATSDSTNNTGLFNVTHIIFIPARQGLQTYTQLHARIHIYINQLRVVRSERGVRTPPYRPPAPLGRTQTLQPKTQVHTAADAQSKHVCSPKSTATDGRDRLRLRLTPRPQLKKSNSKTPL